MKVLHIGDAIPDFVLVGDDGARHAPREWAGGVLVVYFYPRDNTPGCTREAIAFSRLAGAFRRAGATVVGISRDSVTSHCGFRDKHDLTVRLLSDPDLTVHRAFGAWGTKTMYGKPVEGVLRSTFVFDAKGLVIRVWPNVKVDGHAEAVLAALTGGTPTTGKPAIAKPRKATTKR